MIDFEFITPNLEPETPQRPTNPSIAYWDWSMAQLSSHVSQLRAFLLHISSYTPSSPSDRKPEVSKHA